MFVRFVGLIAGMKLVVLFRLLSLFCQVAAEIIAKEEEELKKKKKKKGKKEKKEKGKKKKQGKEKEPKPKKKEQARNANAQLLSNFVDSINVG